MKNNRQTRFERRSFRVRNKLKKNTNLSRLTIYKSGKHLYAQLIDDSKATTIASASTLEKEVRKINHSNSNKESAKKIGALIAERAIKKEVKHVVFDKSGYKFHGVVKAFADEARKSLKF